MTYVALAAITGWALTCIGGLAYVRTLVRPYQIRESDWANRVMHMKGHTWVQPPVETERNPEPVVEYDFVPEVEA